MNTRKDNNGKALKKWAATAPGLIQKPLRHIGNRTDSFYKGRVVRSVQSALARKAANRGDGLYVQKLARSLA